MATIATNYISYALYEELLLIKPTAYLITWHNLVIKKKMCVTILQTF